MIRRLLERLKNVPWLLSGLLLIACYPPVSKGAGIVFALVPILWMVRHKAARFCLKWGYWSGFVYWVATLRWMSALKDTGGPVQLVLFGWFALAAYCALYFGLFGYLAAQVWSWVRTRNRLWRLAAILIAEPVLWAGLELVRSRLLTGFAWNHLGTVPAVMGFGAPAAWGGVYLLSMLVVLVNGSVCSVLARIVTVCGEMRGGSVTSVSRGFRSVETLLPFLVVMGVYLAARTAVATRISSADQVTVGLLQRNFPPPFTDARRRLGDDESPYGIYREMATRLKKFKPDLLVMSESAMCEFADEVHDPRARAVAARLMDASGATAVIAGGSRGIIGRTPLYNSAALYDGGDSPQVYDKVHLVPFGEYIPGDKLFPVLQRLAPVGSCTPGEMRTLDFTLPSRLPGIPDQTVSAGVGICFEDTDSVLMRRFAEKGARLLVFITNDSWFYGSTEPEQHAWQAVARAIETGLPVVRVGNYGVTGYVDPHGTANRQCRATWLADVDGTLRVNAREQVVFEVTLANGIAEFARTPYVRWGDKPLLGAFLLLILTMGVVKYRHDYEKRRKLSLQFR
ncbi:MAG: apolipoprotein N-acyltransferase [Kiritimatiellia bacterium]